MNDGMFIALRAEAQEANSLLKQILEEQKRTNELLQRGPVADKGPAIGTPNTVGTVHPAAPKLPADAVGPATIETVEIVNKDATDAQTPTKKGK